MAEQSEVQSIGVLVRRLEREYINGQTHSSKYVTTSLSEDVNTVYAYLESKHISGQFDSLDREKPFFNICLAARNIWFRATDIDRKNIKIKATKSSDVLVSFIATALLQEWMRKENFGQFLNDWGINSAGFNESIVEFVEKDGRLIPTVLPWNRIIVDAIDVKNNPKIKILELTEAQLRKNKLYKQDMVDKLCETIRPRETTERQRKDNNTGYIKLYEVHGEFSQAQYNFEKGLAIKEGDGDIYFQQIHTISFVESKEKKGEYDEFSLYSGKENDPHMLTALLPEVDGSISLRGSVKNLFQAQWMQNHTVYSIKNVLDFCSKIFLQTADGNLVGQNVLESMQTGQIVLHADGKPLTEVNNSSHDLTQFTNFGATWKQLANEINGISESMLGVTAPSGTAWRQVDALLGESHSLFELMTENKGLAIEQMLRRYVIPFLKKQLDNSDEITTTLEAYGISKIDVMYINNEATKKMVQDDIDKILSGQYPKQDFKGSLSQIQNQLSAQGAQRFFKPSDLSKKTWKDIFKDMEWELECDITGEDAPSKDDLTTLTTVLQTIASNPRVLFDPNAKLVFNKILMGAGGASPLELVDSQPFIPPPTKRLTESLDYVDVPEDIKRQMEEQAGFEPSKMASVPSPINPQTLPAPNGVGSALPVNQ